MAVLKCKSCGGEIEDNGNVYICKSCGESFKKTEYVSKINKSKPLNLYYESNCATNKTQNIIVNNITDLLNGFELLNATPADNPFIILEATDGSFMQIMYVSSRQEYVIEKQYYGDENTQVKAVSRVSLITENIAKQLLEDFYTNKNTTPNIKWEKVNLEESYNVQSSKKGCYVATCVYGSYDCPEVWTLRRFRDYTLDETWYGRFFIKTYYAISPLLVKMFGNTAWFKKLWKTRLDKMVSELKKQGYKDTKYFDEY